MVKMKKRKKNHQWMKAWQTLITPHQQHLLIITLRLLLWRHRALHLRPLASWTWAARPLKPTGSLKPVVLNALSCHLPSVRNSRFPVPSVVPLLRGVPVAVGGPWTCLFRSTRPVWWKTVAWWLEDCCRHVIDTRTVFSLVLTNRWRLTVANADVKA